MKSDIDGATIRRTLLEVVQEYVSPTPKPSFQSGSILNEVAKRLNLLNNIEAQQALLTLWHDLYRSGHISWGFDIYNPNMPFCHLTQIGRKALEHLSRDPFNPDGYLKHLQTIAPISSIPQSYIEESLRTYNSNCFKATAVMIGCANEALLLELRDTLVSKMTSLGLSVPKNLNDWKIKKVIDSLKHEIDAKLVSMPSDLKESYESYWPAFTQQIRTTRNDAGHPASITPVTAERVHASLLIFPEVSLFLSQLRKWISISYT